MTRYGALLLVVFCSCNTQRTLPPELPVHLYAGIRTFVSLGDTENQLKNTGYDYRIEEVPQKTQGNFSEVNVTRFFHFRRLGTKVYFRQNRVVLIEIQEPFRGFVQGKNIRLFSFESSGDKTWTEILVRELGAPSARASGGRFGAQALYYSWGDISYNRMGPNEVAIYTDPAISKYRQKNFGRDVKLFTP